MELRPLLTNGWIGKVALTSLALAFAPAKPLYALLFIVCGFAAGYEWDLYAARRLRVGGAVATRRMLLLAAEAGPWPVYLLCGMGRIASAGGAVLPAHIAQTEVALVELGFTGEQRARGISWFNAGKLPDCPFSELAAACSETPDPRQETLVLEWFTRILALREQAESRQAMSDLTGLLRYRGARLEGEREAAEPAGAALTNPTATLNSAACRAALQFFELPPEPSLATVKDAYRRFVSRCHPDRLPQNATAAELALAQRRMVEGRAAYEELLAVLDGRR